jgi:hypothetical protein
MCIHDGAQAKKHRKGIVIKRTPEGDGDTWVIVLILHLVFSIVGMGREQSRKIPMFVVSLWGVCLSG